MGSIVRVAVLYYGANMDGVLLMLENAKKNISQQGNILLSSFKVGERVELHPATDAWMAGDRYGEIEEIGRFYLHVRMDRSKLLRKLTPDKIGRVI